MATLKQSTAYTRTFLMVDSSDHLSPKTGLTVGVYLSKAGGAFGAVSGSVSELSFGWYKVALNATDTNTLGELAFHCTGSAADLTDFVDQVTGNILGDTLPANVTQWVGVAPNALISGTVDAFAHYGNFSAFATSVGQQRILDRIDYQRGHHTVTGNTFYVDGVSGNDTTGNGSRSAPYLTISKALTVCVANNHDEIILLPNSAGGPTTITESATIVISKAYTQIRGPGRDVLVTVTAGASKDVFSITAGGVELSGFRIATNGASSNGVTVSNQADFVRLYRLWIESAHQDAVQFNVANRCQVEECVFVASGRDGVRVTSGAGTGTHNVVTHTIIRDSVGSAVNLQGSDASDCRIQSNVIRDNAVGVTIASGVVDTVLTDNRFINNTIEISDAGTRTLQQWNYLTSSILGDVMITGTVNANLLTWRGNQPNNLISGTVDSYHHYPVTQDANIVSWRGITPNILISGTVDAFSHYANPTQAFLTGTVDVNLTQWRGTQPNTLISGTVDSFEHYGNPIQSYHTGTVDANLIQIDGLATNGNNATLYLKALDIHTPISEAVRITSDSGVGMSIQGNGGFGHGMVIYGNDVNARGIIVNSGFHNGIEVNAGGTAIQLVGGDMGAYITNLNSNSPAVYLDGAGRGMEIYGQTNDAVLLMSESGDGHALKLLGNGVGTSIYVPNGVVGDITGSITGNVYGDIHGYVGWVTGSVQNVLVSTPAAPPTGTVNANVIQWVGDTPNLLISGTVDAFSHYSNPVQANVSITGTVDANVVTWRSEQPNLLISGTVDAYAHYGVPSTADISTSVWAAGTRTLTSFGTLIADIWAAVVDSSGVTTLLSRLTAGRATNLDNLDDAISNVPTANENADALLKRDWTAVTGEASRSVLNALRFIRNKFSTTAHANKVTIYKEDDTAEAYQKDVTTDATADPIVEG